MAQHIAVAEITELSEIITNSGINFANINKSLSAMENREKDFLWLSTIDEYGVTIFNHLQLPYVQSELQKLTTEPALTKNFDELRELIDFIQDRIESRAYIRFLGD